MFSHLLQNVLKRQEDLILTMQLFLCLWSSSVGSQEGLLEDTVVDPAVFCDKPELPMETRNFNHIHLLALSPLSGFLLVSDFYMKQSSAEF